MPPNNVITNDLGPLLWVLPKWPLPAQDGARVANVNLLKGLAGLGVTIDVLVVAGKNEEADSETLKRETGIRDCRIVRKRTTSSRFRLAGRLAIFASLCRRPWLAATLGPFASRAVRTGIKKIITEGPKHGSPWAMIVYDGLHPAAHASAFGKFNKLQNPAHMVYRAHNVEATIWKRKAALTGFLPLKLFLSLQAFLMARFERSVAEAADVVMTASEDDLNLFRADSPGIRGICVPIGTDFSEIPSVPTTLDTVLFLGRLDWPPNRDGLVWFLENVWPETKRRRPAMKLWIAGSGDSAWMQTHIATPGVTFLGCVVSVEDVYRMSTLAIVPVFYGSGTRVKVIEASRYGRACLSTAMGVEGLGLKAGETYLRAETAAEWIDALVALDARMVTDIGQEAHAQLKVNYHLTSAANPFFRVLRSPSTT